jgi:hypothetical protein
MPTLLLSAFCLILFTVYCHREVFLAIFIIELLCVFCLLLCFGFGLGVFLVVLGFEFRTLGLGGSCSTA